MNDLVKRLRYCMTIEDGGIGLEAADEIERLQKEVETLRLKHLYTCGTTHPEIYKTELDYCKEQLATVSRERDEYESRAIRLAADLLACQKDAERYRWLRDKHGLWFPPANDWYGGEDADEAIDAAMKEQTT